MTGYQSKKLLSDSREGDPYFVKVTLTCESSGHQDNHLFPDSKTDIVFDATDANIDAMLDKYMDFLSAIGYVLDRSRDKFVHVKDQ